jgi:acetyl-CoA synthetase
VEGLPEKFKAARDFLLDRRDRYEEAYTGFEWPELDRFNWAIDWFDAIAAGPRRDQTALWIVNEGGPETRLSFAQISRRSSQVANFLHSIGVERTHRVLLMLGNIAPLWEITLACMKLGAVVVPCSTLLTAGDIVDRIRRADVRHIVSTREFASRFASVVDTCQYVSIGGQMPGWQDYDMAFESASVFTPDRETLATDLFQLYFTSGTTSQPKLVLHNHASYPMGHLSTMYWLGLKPGDIHCNLSSPGWAKHAWSCFLAPWNAEATVFVLNYARFHARELLDALVRCKVTTFCAPPTVWRMLVCEDLSSWKVSLREVASAGEPLNPEVIEEVRRSWSLTIRDGYGQTETCALVGNPPGQVLKPGSMGRPLPGCQIRLLDPEGLDSDEGELCLSLRPRPLCVAPGYQRDDGEVLAVDGKFYRTGDMASRDCDGYLTFIGRADDVFKASDYRICPFELESALIGHPNVVEAAVVPSPDPVRHAVPKAFIQLRAGAEPSREMALSIFRHIRVALAPYKRIRRIEFSELPKTISGKIRRVELRRAEATLVERNEKPAAEFREEDFPELRDG